MRRLLFIVALSFALASPLQAGPRKLLAKTAHALAGHVTLDFAAGASSGLSAYGTIRCRQNNGPEKCADHYGAYKQGIAANAVLTATMISLSEYGRKAGFREWFLPALGVTAGNTIFGVRELRTKAKRDSH